MARMSEKLRLLIKKMSKKYLDAFQKSISNIRTDVQIKELEDAIRSNDVYRVFDALNLSPATYSLLEPAIREAFLSGGGYALEQVRKAPRPDGPGKMVLRFDGRHDQAEQWIRKHSSELIREVTEDTRDLVRDAVRAGMEAGRGPRSVALELIGRINPATGRREGGLIGLTAYQASLVEKARAELLSQDPKLLRAYLSRRRRDGRFDRIVLAAIEKGTPLSRADVNRMLGRYRDGLLKYRGEVIARTEALSSLNAGREEGIRQLIRSGKVSADRVRKVWQSTGDNRTRDSHLYLDGTEVGIDDAFVTINGHRLLHPHDRSLGAPASEIIQCRCFYEIKIQYL